MCTQWGNVCQCTTALVSLVCWPLMCWSRQPGDRPGLVDSVHRWCKPLKNNQESHRGYNSERQWKTPVCSLVPVTHQMARNALHCLFIPQETHHLDKADVFILPLTPCGAASQICQLANVSASRHLLPVEIAFPVSWPGSAHCWTLHVLTQPRRLWSGFKGHSSDVIIHPLSFLCHEKYLPRSVIITVALLWTLSCTRLATPLQLAILFSSKDAVAIPLCHLWLISLWSMDEWKPRGSASWKVAVSAS